jgi:acetyl-CoA carboxylase biotin carboxyl carrier protein
VKVPNGVDVKPPMAGTFYAAPSPGAPPFVEQGRKVKKDQQLGIVEVMKLFTPVPAPCDGTVRAILVGNEQFVDDGQTLMIIEPEK